MQHGGPGSPLRRRPWRWRSLRLFASLVTLVIALLGGSVTAIEITIEQGDRLEIRNVTLPDGSKVELYVLRGQPAVVTIDDQQLVAEEIEFDLSARLVRVIGFGSFTTTSETVEGEDLVIALDDESFTGQDVLIVTQAIDVFGVSASRIPGQISVLSGSFSPCSRCNQLVEDFGFEARRLELFPGDRLVAFDVVLLIRGRPTLSFPLLVVPLGPPDRQPRLSITTGTATERAEVALDWPYVAGANALGTFSIRYFADVTPQAGGPLLNPLLGGSADTHYLGGGVNHRFFTSTGSGAAEFFFTPAFNDLERPGEIIPAQFTVRFLYATEETLDIPQVALTLERDDERRNRIYEYGLRLSNSQLGVRGSLFSQGFVDLDPGDTVSTPSYANRSVPLQTPLQITLEPADVETLTAPPFRLRTLRIDLGAFEDASNPTNRSAAATPLQRAGRLLEAHELLLDPTNLWPGLQLSGRTSFTGKYYSTAERLVAWDSDVRAAQQFGTAGSLELSFRRSLAEGETPFVFDQIPLRTRTDVAGVLQLAPLPWASLRVNETFVITDTRNRQAEGFGPLESTLTLFGNLSFVDATISNSFDVENNDPGTITSELRLRSPDALIQGSLRLRYVQDLEAVPDRLSGEPGDDTMTSVEATFGVPNLTVDISGGYTFRPPPPQDPGDPREFWQPLRLGATLGTLDDGDAIPGLRLALTRDLDRRRFDTVGYEATASLGPLRLRAEQTFSVPQKRQTLGRYSLTWPEIAAVEGDGFAVIQPEWLGLEKERQSETWTVTLRDAPRGGQPAWQLRYRTTWNPLFDGGAGGFQNSALESSVKLEDRKLAGVRFTVDFFSDLQLADDVLQRTFLRRGNLAFGADFYGRVGVQGTLGYLGQYSAATNEITRAALTIDDLAVTVRATDQLFIGGVLNDVWDLTGNNPAESPFNLQPTLFFVWDRCCWALFGQWDTATGQIRVTITTPGASEGFVQTIDTPLLLPGREGGSP